MLERATACLDTGARLSIRCARRASKRNRSLGPNFWSHAASDPDFLPWATGSTTNQHTPPLDVYGPRQRTQHTSKATRDENIANEDASEGPFLDFLYPPQALALLRQNGSQRVERWERRNERRLPKGFIHANRRYSSKATSGKDAAERKTTEPDTEDALDVSWNAERIESDPDNGVVDIVATEAVDPDGPLDETRTSEEVLEDDFSFDEPYAPEPSEMKDVGPKESLHGLRRLIGSVVQYEEPEESLKYTERAWGLFERLGPVDRDDVSLKLKLLQWFSKQKNEAAETYCLDLYHSIPPLHRTLAVYKTALPVFMRSNLYGLAEEGHAEALERLGNGHEVSLLLCRTAIENEMWDLASKFKDLLAANQKQSAQQKQVTSWTDDLFWQQFTDVPNLLPKAINLSKHYRMLKQADALTPAFSRFSISMFKVAIIRQFTASPNEKGRKLSTAEKTLDDSRIRYLIGRIQFTSRDTPRFFRDVIQALILPNPDVRHHDAHNTVSYMYRQYRTMSNESLGEHLLFYLTRRVIEHANTRAGKRKGSWGIALTVLEEDWVKDHGRMSLEMYRWITLYYAKSGNTERVQSYCNRLREQYPHYAQYKQVLWVLIYAYARRGEVKAATTAFEEIQSLANAAGETLDLRNYNTLLHAHSRADDLKGALGILEKLTEAGIKPDVYTIHPVLEIYAARGDVYSVENLLEQCDGSNGPTRRTELYGSLMTAYVNADDVVSAQRVLSELVPKVKTGEVQGTLTKCFNILLTAFALQREVEMTMETYRWMKSEDVKLNSFTYAAIMQGLAMHRQAEAAWKIMNSAMPEEGHKPQAFHYAIVMIGFVRQRAYKTAMDIYAIMIRRDVKPTLSTDAIYAKAKALHAVRKDFRQQEAKTPVSLIMEDLEASLQDPNAGLAPSEPQTYSSMEHNSPRALMFSHLIYSYGSDRSWKAVRQLVDKYKHAAERGDEDISRSLPFRILTAVMPAYIHTKRWNRVEECWKLAKEQADSIAIVNPPLPDPVIRTPNILKLSVAKTTAESQRPKSTAKRAAKNSEPDDPSRPAPALRHILSQPLRHHITSLAFQRRFSEMITTVASVLNQGYTLDNATWNIFIEHLLRSTPPLALLAFRLTERYLIPSFPGWIYNKQDTNLSDRIQKLELIRARYLSPDQLMPQYRTFVKLGAALLAIRRRDALGDEANNDLAGKDNEGLHKYVGSTKQIRKDAPRTLYAVQSMPTVEDPLQTYILRRQAMNY